MPGPLLLLGAAAAHLYTWKAVENGGDLRATHKELWKMAKSTVDLGADVAADVAFVPVSLWKIWMSKDLSSLIEALGNLDKALGHLPQKTRDGLENSIDLNGKINQSIGGALVRCGLDLTKVDDNTSQDEALSKLYLGLFLIGRVGSKLKGKAQTEAVLQLQGIHNSRSKTAFAHESDQALAGILSTYGHRAETTAQFSTHIATLPEVIRLNTLSEPASVSKTPFAIAYGLGGESPSGFTETNYDFLTSRLSKWLEKTDYVP